MKVVYHGKLRSVHILKKWITFDLDETLMQNPFGKWVFPEVEELVAPFAGKSLFNEIRSEHKKRMAQQQFKEAYDWDDIIAQVLETQGISIEIDVEALVKKHSTIPKVYLLENESLEVLQRLKEQGFSLGVVTNGFYKYQFPVMKAIGLAEVMDLVLTPCKTMAAKPDIRMGEERLPVREWVAHVGDRLDHDISFANELGIHSILIDRQMPDDLKGRTPEERATDSGYIKRLFQKKIYEGLQHEEKYKPDYIIHSIHELEHLIMLMTKSA